jgi:excisionase family DNA binding protein
MVSRPHPETLTTGQVADLLGVTVQHVINLCERGQMPYTLVGTHRRIRREDAMVLQGRAAANNGGPLTRDQIRSLWLHRAAAAHIARDPSGSLAYARIEIKRLLSLHLDGESWLRQWLAIIDRGPEETMRIMCSVDPLSRELRQNSPFVGLLSEDERLTILASARKTQTTSTETVVAEEITP